jgi:hypothetical protein
MNEFYRYLRGGLYARLPAGVGAMYALADICGGPRSIAVWRKIPAMREHSRAPLAWGKIRKFSPEQGVRGHRFLAEQPVC